MCCESIDEHAGILCLSERGEVCSAGGFDKRESLRDQSGREGRSKGRAVYRRGRYGLCLIIKILEYCIFVYRKWHNTIH